MIDAPGVQIQRARIALHLKALHAWRDAVEQQVDEYENELIEACLSVLRLNRAIRQTRQQLADTYRHREEMKHGN